MDGRYADLRWDGGQCAESFSDQTAKWRVDLGGVRSMHHIVIQYMTGNRVWGTVDIGVKLIMSNTYFNIGRL